MTRRFNPRPVEPPQQYLPVDLVVSRTRGPLGGMSTGVSDDRLLGADENVTNDDHYGIHIRQDPDPSLEITTVNDIRTEAEAALAVSEYEYAHFGPEPVGEAFVARYEKPWLRDQDHTEYYEWLHDVHLDFEAAAVR